MCLGIPGRVIEIQEVAGLVSGKVDFAGVSRQVSLACVPDVQVGDYVLVHVGFAVSLIDEAEAEQTLEFVRSIPGMPGQELAGDNNLSPQLGGPATPH